jgi:hypothetical protein
MPGLVVCSGRADKPRFIVVPLTLMTPRQSPPGIVSEYPSPQIRMAGAHPWRLGEAPVRFGWPRDKAHT